MFPGPRRMKDSWLTLPARDGRLNVQCCRKITEFARLELVTHYGLSLANAPIYLEAEQYRTIHPLPQRLLVELDFGRVILTPLTNVRAPTG